MQRSQYLYLKKLSLFCFTELYMHKIILLFVLFHTTTLRLNNKDNNYQVGKIITQIIIHIIIKVWNSMQFSTVSSTVAYFCSIIATETIQLMAFAMAQPLTPHLKNPFPSSIQNNSCHHPSPKSNQWPFSRLINKFNELMATEFQILLCGDIHLHRILWPVSRMCYPCYGWLIVMSKPRPIVAQPLQ